MSNTKVLIVDDDPIALAVAQERLENAGYEVHVREKALGTSRWITENKPDIVLLDVMMPALSGSELATVLRRNDLDSVVILHSSKPDNELQKLVGECGAAGAINKSLGDAAFMTRFQALERAANRHRGGGRR